jgi:hypothetical protein
MSTLKKFEILGKKKISLYSPWSPYAALDNHNIDEIVYLSISYLSSKPITDVNNMYSNININVELKDF